MAKIAMHDPGFALEQNYYEKAVEYDRELEQRARNARLGWSLTFDAEAARRGEHSALTLSVRDGSKPVSGARVRVEALRNASAKAVLATGFDETVPGEYRAALPLERGGIWEFRLTVERGAERFTRVERRELREARK
jgi:nitrogen fixation protein FixH